MLKFPLFSGSYLRWACLPPEVGVFFKILIQNLYLKVAADFVGMWVPRSGIQGIVGSVGKSEDFSMLPTIPSFPQRLSYLRWGLPPPTEVGLNVV